MMTANELQNGARNGSVNDVLSNIPNGTAEVSRPTTSIQLAGKVIAITGGNNVLSDTLL